MYAKIEDCFSFPKDDLFVKGKMESKSMRSFFAEENFMLFKPIILGIKFTGINKVEVFFV